MLGTKLVSMRAKGYFVSLKEQKTFLLFFVESHFFKQYIRFLVLFSKWSTLFKIKICSGEHILHTTISCQILYSTTPSLNQSNNDNNINNNNNPCVRTLEGECFQNHPFLNVKNEDLSLYGLSFLNKSSLIFRSISSSYIDDDGCF